MTNIKDWFKECAKADFVKDADETYVNILKSRPECKILSKKELFKIYKDMKSGSQVAITKIANAHLIPTAANVKYTVVNSFLNNNPTCEKQIANDYLSVAESGNQGMIYCIPKWNINIKPLEKYSSWYVKNSVLSYINEYIFITPFDEKDRKTIHRIRQIKKEFFNDCGQDHYPSESELIDYVKKKYPKEFDENGVHQVLYLESLWTIKSLDERYDHVDYSYNEEQRIADLHRQRLIKVYNETLKILGPKSIEALVLNMSFGGYIDENKEIMDAKQIAAAKSRMLSPTQVSRIISKNMRIMQEIAKKY